MLATGTTKSYDLGLSPDFGREERQALEQLFGRFALTTARCLGSRLNIDVAADYAGLKRVFVEEVKSDNPFKIIELRCDEPPLLLQFDRGLAFLLLESSLGGRPTGDLVAERTLTPLEARILEPFWDVIARQLKLILRCHEGEYAPVGHESTSSIQAIFAHYSLHSIKVTLELFNLTAELSVIIPTHLLRDLGRFSDHLDGKPTAVLGDHGKTVNQHLAPALISVTAELAVARLSLNDLANLEADDVIVGSLPIDSPVTISLNGLPKYQAIPLQIGGGRAVRLSRLVSLKAPNV